MTGKHAPISSWLPDVTVPALVVAGEAGWAVLLMAGRVRVHDHVSMDLPYLAVAVPAVVAVVALAWAQHLRTGRRRQLAARWGVGIVGAALTAGIVSELTVPGSLLVVATHPWSSGGHTAATVAGMAWVVAILAWARGAWLDTIRVSSRHAGVSIALGGATFLSVFIAHASSPHGPFAAATSDVGWLFFVTFLLGGASVSFARQRDIEDEAVPGVRSSRPTLAWGSALAAPMLVVALLGLAVAFVGGPAARVLGDGLRLGADGLAWLIGFLFSWIPAIHAKAHPLAQHVTGVPAARPRAARPQPLSPLTKHIALALLILLAIGLVVAIVILVKRLWPKRRSKPQVDDADEEEDSVFSWGHVLAQLLSGLRRLLPRRRRRAPAETVAASATSWPGGPDAIPPPDSVREAYRRVLVEARTLGSPRHRSETTIELEGRLLATMDDPAAGSFRRLTAIYDDVRYGERETGADDDRAARLDVDAFLPALRDQLTPPEAEPAAEDRPARVRTLAPLSRRRRWWRRRRP
jgi:Domain of unknown function (DUF4129)